MSRGHVNDHCEKPKILWWSRRGRLWVCDCGKQYHLGNAYRYEYMTAKSDPYKAWLLLEPKQVSHNPYHAKLQEQYIGIVHEIADLRYLIEQRSFKKNKDV